VADRRWDAGGDGHCGAVSHGLESLLAARCAQVVAKI